MIFSIYNSLGGKKIEGNLLRYLQDKICEILSKSESSGVKSLAMAAKYQQPKSCV